MNRLIYFLILTALAALVALIGLNVLGLNWGERNEKYLSPNDVRGMEVYAKEIPYTLNFGQQNQVIQILNRAVPVSMSGYLESEGADFNYQKLVIYRFNQPAIELTPVGIIRDQLLLKVPAWNPEGFIRETGTGQLNPLLNAARD